MEFIFVSDIGLKYKNKAKIFFNLKMNFNKVVGVTYIFVILALICHIVGAVPKQHDANSDK